MMHRIPEDGGLAQRSGRIISFFTQICRNGRQGAPFARATERRPRFATPRGCIPLRAPLLCLSSAPALPLGAIEQAPPRGPIAQAPSRRIRGTTGRPASAGQARPGSPFRRRGEADFGGEASRAVIFRGHFRRFPASFRSTATGGVSAPVAPSPRASPDLAGNPPDFPGRLPQFLAIPCSPASPDLPPQTFPSPRFQEP
jgi:hypothetical protein